MIAVVVIIILIGVIAAAAMAYNNRTDAGIESGISSFQRELDALAPRGEPLAGRVSRPDGSRTRGGDPDEDDQLDDIEVPSINGPKSGRVTILPGRGTDDDGSHGDGVGPDVGGDVDDLSDEDGPRRRRRRPAPEMPAGLRDIDPGGDGSSAERIDRAEDAEDDWEVDDGP